MNDGLKVSGVIAAGAVMIACCVAISVGSVAVLGAFSGLLAWLGGLDPVIGAGVGLVVAAVASGVIRGKKQRTRTRLEETAADTTDLTT